MFYRNVYDEKGFPLYINNYYVGIHNFYDGNCKHDYMQYNRTKDGKGIIHDPDIHKIFKNSHEWIKEIINQQ